MTTYFRTTYERRGVTYELIIGERMDSVRVTSLMAKGVVILEKAQTPRLIEWLHGEGLIQTQLPDLSANDREILMTGIGPKEWDEIFKGGK